MSTAQSNLKSVKILENLPDRKSKVAYFAGGRVTTGSVTQYVGKSLIKRYVGKLRGVVVCDKNGEHIFDEEGQAIAAAKWFLADCKREAELI